MNFSLAEEQQLLREAVLRFLDKDYGFERRRAVVQGDAGWSPEVWRGLAGLGVLGVLVPQACDGYGGRMIDAAVVMEALGEGLLVEPFVASSILGTSAIVRCGTPAQQARILPGVAAGETVLAFAHAEPGAGLELESPAATAVPGGGGYVLSGRKSLVLHGAQAGVLIVSAAIGVAGGGAAPVGLFMVPAKSRGLSVHDHRTIDGLRAADVALDGVQVARSDRLDAQEDASAAIGEILDRAAAAACAEAIGVMQRLQAQTLDYIKTRQQFGQPIGRFQVLQHRAADMYMLLELSRSMAYFAAMAADDDNVAQRRARVSAAKAYVGRAARWVAQAALQMHGGIGMTDELPASHYVKRLTMLDFWFGTREEHLQRFVSYSCHS